jgi:hypothetical protein
MVDIDNLCFNYAKLGFIAGVLFSISKKDFNNLKKRTKKEGLDFFERLQIESRKELEK